MVAFSLNATLGPGLYAGGDSAHLRYAPSATNAPAAASVSTTTVAANVATLVADGATPTQAHVTTLNTNWAILLAAINASNLTIAGDVQVQVNNNVATRAQLKACLDGILQAAVQSGMVSP